MQIFSLLALALLLSAHAPASPRQEPPPPPVQASPTSPTPDASGAYKVGHGVLPPRLLSSVDPEYSEEARRAGIDAHCTVALTIDVNGRPKDIHITHSAAEGQPQDKQQAAATLDPMAIKAIQKYRFAPAKLNGQPVPVVLNVEVTFNTFVRN